MEWCVVGGIRGGGGEGGWEGGRGSGVMCSGGISGGGGVWFTKGVVRSLFRGLQVVCIIDHTPIG